MLRIGFNELFMVNFYSSVIYIKVILLHILYVLFMTNETYHETLRSIFLPKFCNSSFSIKIITDSTVQLWI